MLKTPISFKGPSGQIQSLFTEKTIFKATQMLLDDQLSGWHYNEVSQVSRARIVNQAGEVIEVSMLWPIDKEHTTHGVNAGESNFGTCGCDAPKPCVHLAALTVFNKSKLDQLPPFTQQVKALRDINTTFMAWLNHQRHDPYPGMARHRVAYILDLNEKGHIKVGLFKAYLSQDDKFQVKAEIDSSLFFRKQLPKFVSEIDQYVMYEMNQNGLAKVHQFTVDPNRDEDMLLMIFKSQRCFWKACYRAPISLEEVAGFSDKSLIQITPHLKYALAENSVHHLIKQKGDAASSIKSLSETSEFQPQLNITSTVMNFEWRTEPVLQMDVAHPQFSIGSSLFDLDDLVKGRVKISPAQLELVSSSCYQIEKLMSVYAAFEPPVNQHFQINDRYLGDDFTAIAPLLVALKQAGWVIDIAADFRLNHAKADQWYVEVNELKSAAAQGWYDLKVGVEIDQKQFNLMPFLLKAIKTGAFDAVKNELMVQLDNGLNLGIDKQQINQILTTINELYDGQGDPDQLLLSKHQLVAVAQAQPKWEQALHAEDSSLQWLGHKEVQEKSRALKSIEKLEEATLPVHLRAELRPYQHEGFSWLCFLANHGFHGLLADDMGLGKTLQTLAFIQAQKERQPTISTSLIVAPTSLLGNWVAEANKFTPQLKVGVMTGSGRQTMYDSFEQYDLIVTSYGIISRDFVDLNRKSIHLLVLDEAQAIKNRKTQVAQIIKRLSPEHRLCLSGTPVENHLGELWSIFDFLMPGFLGTERQFQQRFQWPIEKENDVSKLNELQSRIAPFVLRRTKQEVAKELPAKSEIIKFIELDESQATVYESIRLTMADEIRKAVKNQQNNQILIGNALLRLRQVCCHPRLVQLKSIDNEAKSAKLNWLTTALPNLVEEGRNILIFSSFTGMLDIIANQLASLGIGYFELTGKTSPAKRTEYIAGFQARQRPVFLISLKAGGAGINLTAADTVIHYDPWWNPAAEQQASDRAHRIGQDKQVFVYKLITRGTVEEKIHHLQLHKQQLAAGLLSNRADISEILSEHQWESMLSPIDS